MSFSNHSTSISFDSKLDNILQEIVTLKKEMGAIILSHYYQEPELQDIADFIGDSFALSKQAKQANSKYIFFCGVRFMAEVAKILNPSTKVIIPDMNAGCSLEDSCPPSELKKFIDKNPDYYIISYINCSTEVKALSDVIVTSANATKIISKISKDKKILFAPDKYLGSYLIKTTKRDMKLWNGTCIVHENFSEKELIKLNVKYPSAKIIAHPECPETLLNYSDFIGSTSALLKYVEDNKDKDFIVLTERGIIHKMQQANPDSKFYDVPAIADEKNSCSYCNDCKFMKLNTAEKLLACMKNKTPEIILEPTLMAQAKKPLDKMLELAAN